MLGSNKVLIFQRTDDLLVRLICGAFYENKPLKVREGVRFSSHFPVFNLSLDIQMMKDQ